MPMKVFDWRIVRMKGKAAYPLGWVEATDEQSAIKLAIKKFKIRPEDRWRIGAQLIGEAKRSK